MPLIGYYLGRSFASSIESIDHWVAFILLAFIGGKMIWEALKKEDDTDKNRDDYRIQTLTPVSYTHLDVYKRQRYSSRYPPPSPRA